MPTLADPDPHGLAPIVTRPEALAAGMTRDEVRHRLRSGRWRALAPGLYLREPLDGDDPCAVVRLADLGANDVNVTAEVPVTVPARTWVDVARSSPLADALSVGDSALRLVLTTP
ncbi:MAG: hypothetical protein F2881_03480 [Actinobacteria bacterium]|nr:hypothetical protein [Actinomycetota bacterium]